MPKMPKMPNFPLYTTVTNLENRVTRATEVWDHVQHHYEIASILATVGLRPPGYSIEEWTWHLLEKEREDLQARLKQKTDESQEKSSSVTRFYVESSEAYWARQRHTWPQWSRDSLNNWWQKWLLELFLQRSYDTLTQLKGQSLDTTLVHYAESMVDRVYFDMTHELRVESLNFSYKLEPRVEDGSLNLHLVIL
jgi:hypothetical protein